VRVPDRVLGALFVLLGGWIFAVARGFTVGFLVDPVGPRGLPYLVAGIFTVGGGALLLRKAPGPATPERTAEGARALARWCGGLGVLLLYATGIPLLGFVPSTVLGTGALSRLFGGRWLPGLAVGLALGLGLLGLFSLGFGMDLPTGALFEGGR